MFLSTIFVSQITIESSNQINSIGMMHHNYGNNYCTNNDTRIGCCRIIIDFLSIEDTNHHVCISTSSLKISICFFLYYFNLI